MNNVQTVLTQITWKRVRAVALMVAVLVWLGPPVVQAIDAVVTIVFRGLVILGVALATKYHKEIMNWLRTSGKEAMKEVF